MQNVLVDTSVWIDHFRKGNVSLSNLLGQGQVLMHESVLGELSCGMLPSRKQTLIDLAKLPRAEVPPHAELLRLAEEARLFGQGMGWMDIQLLGSAIIAQCTLYTLDRALNRAATRLRVAYV